MFQIHSSMHSVLYEKRILLDTLWSCAIYNAKLECDISLYLLLLYT